MKHHSSNVDLDATCEVDQFEAIVEEELAKLGCVGLEPSEIPRELLEEATEAAIAQFGYDPRDEAEV